MSVDVTSDLFVAGRPTTATTGDASVLPALLRADPMAVAEVVADTHSGDAESVGEARDPLSGMPTPMPMFPYNGRGVASWKLDQTSGCKSRPGKCRNAR